MSRIRMILIAVLTFVIFCSTNYGATNTNFVANAKEFEPVKIGHLVFEGGDGSSIEQAVVIRNAKDEEEGVGAETKWIGKVHPGWRKGDQALLGEKGKRYDQIEYTMPDGKTTTIFFDITEFFGK